MKPLFTACVLIAAWIRFAPLGALAGDSPEQVLADHGLKPSGNLWYAASDQRITDRVQMAERLERRVVELRKHVDRMLDQNELMKSDLANRTAVQKLRREARNRLKEGSPERKRLDDEIKNQDSAIEELKKHIVPADKLGAAVPLKPAVMELVGARSELAFHLLSARRRIGQLPELYAGLRKNDRVLAALASLEPPGQLGDARAFANETRSLERMESLIFTGELPFYREDKRMRVTGIANEELPITFTFYESSEPTVITHSMAESLGLEIAGKPRKERRIDDRQVKVTPVQLNSLRLGEHVLRDVDALVLAPDHENLGARIGLPAMKGLRVRVIPERLRVQIEARAETTE